MRVITTATDLSRELDEARRAGHSVGLVPTMGALHAGHRSLVERAAQECDVVVVSVFVNPTQFNDRSDLERYPRDLDGDVALAEEAGASLVFAPQVEEMYPGFPDTSGTTVHVAGVTEAMEGASRPGHFDGVATVVTKLLAITGRCRAYFGEKDYQQLAVVRRLVADLRLPVDVVACATVRDPDGVALSSRNARLSSAERVSARVLHQALLAGVAAIEDGERDPERVADVMEVVLAGEPGVVVDYATVVDAATLQAPQVVAGEVRLLLAGWLGSVRLIDNLGATAPPIGPYEAEERSIRLCAGV